MDHFRAIQGHSSLPLFRASYRLGGPMAHRLPGGAAVPAARTWCPAKRRSGPIKVDQAVNNPLLGLQRRLARDTLSFQRDVSQEAGISNKLGSIKVNQAIQMSFGPEPGGTKTSERSAKNRATGTEIHSVGRFCPAALRGLARVRCAEGIQASGMDLMRRRRLPPFCCLCAMCYEKFNTRDRRSIPARSSQIKPSEGVMIFERTMPKGSPNS